MFPYFCVSMLFKSLIKIKIQFESRLHYIDIFAYHCTSIMEIGHLILRLQSLYQEPTKNYIFLKIQKFSVFLPEGMNLKSYRWLIWDNLFQWCNREPRVLLRCLRVYWTPVCWTGPGAGWVRELWLCWKDGYTAYETYWRT